MPELPEVETVCRQLEREIKGAIIKDVVVRFGQRLTPRPPQFIRLLKGKKVVSVERRAKLVLVRLSDDLTMVMHLKLTGRLLIKGKGEAPTKHTHVVFILSKAPKGALNLHFEDMRKFGFIKLLDNTEADKFISDQRYGPDPLERSFTWQKMAECLRQRPSAKIKPWLMEQKCIAGIGNIYATEALWFAKIHPFAKVKKITDVQMRALYRAVINVLRQAIPARGSSVDAYLDIYGQAGVFVPKLKAYGREGKECRRCGIVIKKIQIAGRGSAFCPKCQKLYV